jgi:hypothetical protein
MAEVVFPRSSWEPSIAKNPKTGELVVMFFGNITSPPDMLGPGCTSVGGNPLFNLTTTNTYISISKSGSILGPWEPAILAKGMENKPKPDLGITPYSWNCASGNPGPAFHPNGTLYAAMRQNPCWKGFTTREHIGLWRLEAENKEDGLLSQQAGRSSSSSNNTISAHSSVAGTGSRWDGTWTCLSQEPLYGWGNGGGSERNCSDANLCPSHEDPHLWWDEKGAHLLTHVRPRAQPTHF